MSFRYHNGQGEVHGDPTTLRRNLILETGGRLTALLKDYYASNRLRKSGGGEEAMAQAELASCAAASILLPVVRNVFGLVPFDPATGRGATDDDADKVLCDFQNYLSDLKKKHATSPSTVPSGGSDSLANSTVKTASV